MFQRGMKYVLQNLQHIVMKFTFKCSLMMLVVFTSRFLFLKICGVNNKLSYLLDFKSIKSSFLTQIFNTETE